MTPRRTFLAIVFFSAIALPGAAWSQVLDQLLKAADRGDASTVAELLNKGADPNSADKTGNTLLMIAAVQGHEAVVKVLIERKADLARRNSAGDSALMLACLKGHLGTVKLLVDKGAPVAISGWAPLHYASFEGRADVIRYLLDHGADKNALAPNGDSALLLTTRGGFGEAARMLLYEDVDVTIVANNGDTALKMATKRNDKDLVELLKRAGAYE